MKFNNILVIILLLTSFLIANDYRTITRATPIILKDGSSHNQIKDFGEYHALLIYVEEYTVLKNLETPKEDIKEIAEILQDRYCFAKKNIHILPNPKNHDELVGKLDELKNSLGKRDNLLIYYAGHGSVDKKTQKGYWNLSYGQDIAISRVGSVSLDEAITNTLKTMRSQHILIISDSCYSGILTRKGERGSFGSIDKSEMKYYSKLHDIQSRTVLTSGGLEPVLDRDSINSKHSIFANSFLKMLRDNQNALFALNEKYKDIRLYVWNGANQTPTYEGLRLSNHNIGGDFIFLDKRSIYTNKDIKVGDANKTPLVIKVIDDSPMDKILLWSLGIVSFLFLFILILYLKIRKKDVEIDNKKVYELNQDVKKRYQKELNIPTTVKREEKPKDGAIKMGKLFYQNQLFTKQMTWQEAKEYAKNLRVGGFDDWRLPTRDELRALGNIKFYGEYDIFWEEWYQNHKDSALVNSKGEKHFIDERLIENIPKDSWFWTSEAKDEDDIWRVGFHLGCSDVCYDEDMSYILCVRDKKEGER